MNKFLNKDEFYTWLKGKKVSFIGAGVSHKALIEIFVKKGAVVTLCDKKKFEDMAEYKDKLVELQVNLSLGENYLDGIKNQDLIMRTPGFNYNNEILQEEIAKGKLVLSEIELFLQLCPCKIYAITGSDGKTTTTSLISSMLKKEGKTVHLGGNIGFPLLERIDDVNKEDIAVVELSSFQLISMDEKVDVSVVTNVTPNHLDYHKDMAEYIQAKKNIFLNQDEKSKTVLGYNNEISRNMINEVKGKTIYFTRFEKLDKGGFIDDNGNLMLDDEIIVNKNDVGLRGEHNLENILAACCAVKGDVSIENMRYVAINFKGVEHRLEPVRELDGVKWYNDSIGTSPTRTIAGLNSFDRKVCIIAGGYDKKISYQPLAEHLVKKVKLMVTIGQTAPLIEDVAKNHKDYNKNDLEIIRANDMKEAVNILREKTQRGDIAILSPASASFDMYENFEIRGNHFKTLVNDLK